VFEERSIHIVGYRDTIPIVHVLNIRAIFDNIASPKYLLNVDGVGLMRSARLRQRFTQPNLQLL
jgi:hypothetical protein